MQRTTTLIASICFVSVGVLSFVLTPVPIVCAASLFSSSATKLIDAQTSQTVYDYGPSIINVNGTYHAYVCAAGCNAVNSWDFIRHSSSLDRRSWTTPVIVLQARNAPDSTSEWSACDPSVVYFNSGDGPYYYLYYGGGNGRIYVARSNTPDGPFAKYTAKGWRTAASAIPAAVAQPQNRRVLAASSTAPQVWYGAGEPTVVAKDRTLLMWYSDDTSDLAIGPSNYHVYRRTSSDAVHWSAAEQLDTIPLADSVSVEVKYDARNDLFILFTVENQISLESQLATLISRDGVTWSNRAVICDTTCLPHYSSNVGVSSDSHGQLDDYNVLIAYGAPYILDGGNTWGAWNLWVNLANLNNFPALQNILRLKPAAPNSPGLLH